MITNKMIKAINNIDEIYTIMWCVSSIVAQVFARLKRNAVKDASVHRGSKCNRVGLTVFGQVHIRRSKLDKRNVSIGVECVKVGHLL